MCAFAVACSTPDEPVIPQSDGQETSEIGAATRAGQTIVIDESTRLVLAPGTVLSAAAADYFTGVIDGATYPQFDENEYYEIPLPVPAGILFDGFTVTSTGNWTTLPPYNTPFGALWINFWNYTAYTLRADFTIPGGDAYLEKIVTVPPMIRSVTNSPQYPMPGNYMTFTAEGPDLTGSGLEYEWTVESGATSTGIFVTNSRTRQIQVPYDFDMDSDRVVVGCRIRRNGSPWSNKITAFVYPPNTRRALADSEAEELESVE